MTQTMTTQGALSDDTMANPQREAIGHAMSFGDHLDELRRRLMWALVGLVPCLIIGIAVAGPGLERLLRPVKAQLLASGLPAKLQATGVLETFGAYVRVSIIVMLLLGLPWCVWQLWLFVAPGLYKHEKLFARMLVPFSVLLSLVGVLFLYYVMLPAMLYFLISFGSSIAAPMVNVAEPPAGMVFPTIPTLEADPISPQPLSFWFNTELNELRYALPGPDGRVSVVGADLVRSLGIVQQYRISEYMNMVFFTAIAFAFGFQTPIVVLLLGWVGIVDRAFLARHRRYAVAISMVASAVLTPSPDPLSMFMLAVPLYGLYELGLLLLKWFPGRGIVGLANEAMDGASEAVEGIGRPGRERGDAGDA
jgi:sec-independent protein translocase protein TatC